MTKQSEQFVSARTGEAQRFRTSDGISICYRSWGSEGKGRPLLLQHGFASDSMQEWGDCGVVEALVKAGRLVVAVDARGHGKSDAPHEPASYGESRLALDLLELASALSPDQVDMVGYSMGAVAVLRAASTEPEKVRKICVGGVGSGIVEVGGVDTRVVDTRVLAEAFRAPNPSDIEDPGLAAWRVSAEAGGGDALALAAVAESFENSVILLEKIRATTLVFAGDADPFASRPEVLTNAIKGARMEILRGDHTTARYDPRLAASLADFLSAP